MSTSPRGDVDPNDLRSRLRSMTGRDPRERERAASTLELLFDLTFVVAVAQSASQLAEALAEGHVGSGIAAFCLTSFGIIWAWINYSWFASAYDTDDWLYRLLTLLQMIGVVVLTLGIPDIFHAAAHGELDNTVSVTGYVIMRVAMLVQWGRAHRTDGEHRPAIRFYLSTLVIAQALWVATIFLQTTGLPLPVLLGVTALIALVELTGPFLAERGSGTGTPWHAGHITERHGLLTIITIGEVVTGTVITLQNILGSDEQHIDWGDTILVAVCGTAIAFGFWWAYFIPRFAEVLHHHRRRSFGFGYSHFLIWPALAAVGGGLHLMALSFEHSEDLHVDHVVAACALAIPVGVFTVGLFTAHYLTTRFWAGLHTAILTSSLVVLAVAVVLAVLNVPLTVVLALCTLVPWITVAAFELSAGADHEARVLAELPGCEGDDAVPAS
ncbi:low temperature requirement protein A [Kocuria tytonicola]|nr:low temperature requirement protein A [Kocuria tytonicola]